MRFTRWAVILAIPAMLFALAGCGSDSNGAFNPTSLGTGGSTGGGGGGTPIGVGTVLSYNLALSLTGTSGTGTTVGPNSTVIATATMKDSNDNPVANQPIKFEAIGGGPVTIDPVIVSTDSNGKAINFLKAGATTASAVDVIIKASTSVNNQLVSAIGIFTIKRSEGNVIQFITTKDPTDPDGTLNTLAVTLVNAATPSSREILQLVPFQVLDSNGVPISRVPVTISVYSEIGNCPVFIDSPEATAKTVTTDDTGLGIFNAGVIVAVPEVGSENSCSIIYKAEAADPYTVGATIYSYGGFIATLKNVLPQ